MTTFIDYYGLPSDFPGMDSRPTASPYNRARHVEEKWKKRIDHPRFYPYLMVHEFEALLFVKPDELSRALYKTDLLPELQKIRNAFPTPEDINDNPETAPSKSIFRILPGYQKTLHGPLVTRRIGMETMRHECPHFNEWLTWLEGL